TSRPKLTFAELAATPCPIDPAVNPFAFLSPAPSWRRVFVDTYRGRKWARKVSIYRCWSAFLHSPNHDRGQAGFGYICSFLRSAVTWTRPVSIERRSSTPESKTSPLTEKSGFVCCWRPRVKVMNTGHALPGGLAIGS